MEKDDKLKWKNVVITEVHINVLKDLYEKRNGIKNPLDDFLYGEKLPRVSYRKIITFLIGRIIQLEKELEWSRNRRDQLRNRENDSIETFKSIIEMCKKHI